MTMFLVVIFKICFWGVFFLSLFLNHFTLFKKEEEEKERKNKKKEKCGRKSKWNEKWETSHHAPCTVICFGTSFPLERPL